MAGELAGTVIGDFYFPLLTWLDRSFGVLRDSTSAGGDSLVDDERRLANVGESKGAVYNRLLL